MSRPALKGPHRYNDRFYWAHRAQQLDGRRIIGFLNVPLISAVFAVPRGKLFDAALKDAFDKGEMTPELRAHMVDPVVKFAHWYELGAMVAIVFLMVFRPF